MRLGDLDALAGKLKNGLENAKNAEKENYVKIFEVFIDWVSREPTIDLVPVVRCRECKSYDHGCCVVKRYRGDDSIITMPPDGYCSYGQRKEADHD